MAKVLVIAAETLMELITKLVTELIGRMELLVKLTGRTELV